MKGIQFAIVLLTLAALCTACAEDSGGEPQAEDSHAPAEAESTASDETFTPSAYAVTTVLDLGYGEGVSQPGYLPFNEGDEVHPDAIAVTEDGRLLITDPVKGRLLVYDSATGAFVGPLQVNGAFGVGITWCSAGMATLDTAAHEILLLSDDGAVIASYPLPVTHGVAEALYASDEGIWASAEGVRFLVARYASPGSLTAVEDPALTETDGYAFGAHTYRQDYASGRIVRESSQAEPELTIDVGDDFGDLRVVGEAEDGSFFVHTWKESTGGRILVFDSSGEEAGSFPLEQSSVDSMDLWVTPDGVLYQLWHDAAGIRVYAYELTGE